MKFKIAVILLIIFRLWLTTYTKHGDLHNGWRWAGEVSQRGTVGFYDLPKGVFTPQSRPNQPAGSVYLYAFSYQFNSLFYRFIKFLNSSIPFFPSSIIWWWERLGDVVSLKLPSVVGDLVLVAAFQYFGAKHHHSKSAHIVSLLYLLNPPLWYNSSFWGQNDCIVAALAVWSILMLFEGRVILSGFLIGASVITKASWSPIMLPLLLYSFKVWPKKFVLFVLTVGVSALLLFSPFHPQLDLPIWLSQLYLSRILPGESSFITVNAFNFWHVFFPIDKTLDTAPLLGIPSNLISYGLLLLLVIYTIRSLWRDQSQPNFIKTSLILYFGFFLFSTRMHERYMYPLFPLLSFLLILGQKLWWQYAVLSFTFLANLYSMWFAPTMPWLISLYTPLLTKTLSLLNLATYISLFQEKR